MAVWEIQRAVTAMALLLVLPVTGMTLIRVFIKVDSLSFCLGPLRYGSAYSFWFHPPLLNPVLAFGSEPLNSIRPISCPRPSNWFLIYYEVPAAHR